jgi:hypothetical protein
MGVVVAIFSVERSSEGVEAVSLHAVLEPQARDSLARLELEACAESQEERLSSNALSEKERQGSLAGARAGVDGHVATSRDGVQDIALLDGGRWEVLVHD